MHDGIRVRCISSVRVQGAMPGGRSDDGDDRKPADVDAAHGVSGHARTGLLHEL